VSYCIELRKPVPVQIVRVGTLRYAWLRAPQRAIGTSTKPNAKSRRLTQKAPYEGGLGAQAP
jgi:hypothetical protein